MLCDSGTASSPSNGRESLHLCNFFNLFFSPSLMASEASQSGQRGARAKAPVVDSVSCYCQVDAGLKTVVGATKFVPGAKLCTQPDINPRGPKPKNLRRERSRTQPPLIPGLPDDLAISCLIRVTRSHHPHLRLVSRRWNRLLTGNYYYSLRKKYGMVEDWIYVIRKDREGKISWHAFDPTHQLWQPLPSVPPEYSQAVGFRSAVLSTCYLYLFGGKDPAKGSVRRVVFYNARTNRWYRAPHMQRKRHFFGSCVINNCLYVAGGECEGMQRTLKSTEVYDPNKNRWAQAAEMVTGLVPFIGVVYKEKWFLKGLDSNHLVVSQVYDPKTNCWSIVDDGMVTGWRNPCISMNGKLYASDCRDGCKLRVYSETSDSWEKFMEGNVYHLGSSRALEAAGFVSLNEKLGIVRNNMSISLVDVLNTGKAIETSSAQNWENVGGRGQLKTFVANLWSSIAGRNGLKSHIVHCHVLQT